MAKTQLELHGLQIGEVIHGLLGERPMRVQRFNETMVTLRTIDDSKYPKVREWYHVRPMLKNGICMLMQGFHGDNREYHAIRNHKVIGEYAVDNYLRGIDTIGSGNSGEINGKQFVGSWREWRQALENLS